MKTYFCPCASGKIYSLCCGRFHKGKLHAPTAETLMRSRFSAYAMNNIQYIYRTWSKDTRPPLQVLQEKNDQVFTHLEVISFQKGQEHDSDGTVEFIASYTIGNLENTSSEVYQHHENSYFLKKQGKWEYIDELSKIDAPKHLS